MSSYDNYEFYRDLPKWNKPVERSREVMQPIPRLNDSYYRAAERSVASDKVKPVSRKKANPDKVAKLVLTLATCAIIATSALATLGISNFVEETKTSISVSQFEDEMRVMEAMNDASWSYVGKDGNLVFGYNHHTLADYVDASGKYSGWHDNQDTALFALYNRMPLNKVGNMNEIVTRIKGDYTSWDDYLVKHGFVDKRGNPSNEMYKEEMSIRIATGFRNENFDEKHGMKR